MEEKHEGTHEKAPEAAPEKAQETVVAPKPVVHERTVEGRILSATGPVVDVKFKSAEDMPIIDSAIHAESFTGKKILLQVAEHVPGNVCRCISLHETMNLQRNSICITHHKKVQ